MVGVSAKATGVWGQTQGAASGVVGTSTLGYGVAGESVKSAGVRGTSTEGRGVEGWSTTWEGVVGISQSSTGVWGQTESGFGVLGSTVSGVGVWGKSETGEGVHAETNSGNVAAIAAFNLNPMGSGAAVFGEKRGSVGHAGFFVGNVHVTGKLTCDQDICCTNADCAEEFDIANSEPVQPGTVMVVGDEGRLHPSSAPYDKRVAGVISGAGTYRPAVVLDRQPARQQRQPIALLGKVYCKVDATRASIATGDLLTTSATPGHAMKANDPQRALGAIIGKALRPLGTGKGEIPILIALQ